MVNTVQPSLAGLVCQTSLSPAEPAGLFSCAPGGAAVFSKRKTTTDASVSLMLLKRRPCLTFRYSAKRRGDMSGLGPHDQICGRAEALPSHKGRNRRGHNHVVGAKVVFTANTGDAVLVTPLQAPCPGFAPCVAQNIVDQARMLRCACSHADTGRAGPQGSKIDGIAPA